MSAAREYLSSEQIAELRRLSPLRGVGAIAWTWLWILAAWGLYLWRPSVLTLAVGWLIVSSRHLALAILMHEAAHCLIVHLFMFVPHYRLPLAHRMLRATGVLANAEIASSYWQVLKRATGAA